MRGFTISALLHGALLAWALVSFSATAPLKLPEPEPVEVAIITEGDIVRLRQGDRQAKQLEARPETKPAPETQQPEAQKPKPPPPPTPPPPPPPPPKAETPPEPPKPEPKAEVKPEPPPEPKPDAIADKIAALPPEPVGPSPEELARQEAARKAEEQKRLEDQKRAEEKKKADEKKRREDEKKKRDEAEKKRLAELKRKEDEKKKKEFESKIAALIDKSPDPRGAPQPSPANVSPDARAKGPTAGAKEGTDSQLTASQRSMIGVMMRQAVSRCWNINAGAQGIDKVVVRIEVMLTREGRINGNPKVVNNQPGPLFSDAANSALRALVQCEPYDLPANLYEGGWDHMIVTFDPQAMFR